MTTPAGAVPLEFAAMMEPGNRARSDGDGSDARVADDLRALVRSDPGRFDSVAAMAGAVGMPVSRLRSVLLHHLHTSPQAFLARERIRHLQTLLAAGALEGGDAREPGFAWTPSLEASFIKATGLTPPEYARLGEERGFELRFPRGYMPRFALRMLGRDAGSPAESVDGRAAAKALQINGKAVVLRLLVDRDRARCEVSTRGRASPALVRGAHAAAVRLLGLDCDPGPFNRALARQPDLRPLVAGRTGLRVLRTVDLFESLAWAIIGQQINLAFAYKLRRALIELAGPKAPGGMRAHPLPADVARLDVADLTKRQFSRRKAEYLVGAAQAMVGGDLDPVALEEGTAPEVRERLTAVRGIGPWTASYVMMRGLGFADCVPVGDAGLVQALRRFFALAERPDAARTEALMAQFAPHRSLASFHLWTSLWDH